MESRDRLRILLIIGTLDIGGTERQLVELACGLNPLRFAPVVVCLSAGGPFHERLLRHGVPVHILGFRGIQWDPIGGVRELYRLVRLIQSEKPHVIQVFLYWACVVGGLAARLAGHRHVIAARRSLGTFKSGKPLLLLAERLVNRWVRLFVANSEAVKEDVCRRERVDRQQVTVIYNGYCQATQESELVTAESGIQKHCTGSAPVVAVLANFIHYKGHTWFLDAWRQVVARLPSAKAVLIGDGPMRPAIEALLAQYGLNNSVILTGRCINPGVWLKRADLLVHTSSEEGCCNAILEGMALGLPIVAADVGGNTELVQDGKQGRVISYGDTTALVQAICHLASEPVERSRMGAAGVETVSRMFTMARMCAEYASLYERISRI
ncbi:MAG TPA: glycosyltransferase [Candidatus Ozemobacteraceae bacterium]|nr:glycosyltransferase [Candidatus Ozemobacteraceae bacterium]